MSLQECQARIQNYNEKLLKFLPHWWNVKDAHLALSGEKHAHSLRHDRASRLKAFSRERKNQFWKSISRTEYSLVEFGCTVLRQRSLVHSTWHEANCIIMCGIAWRYTL